MFRLAIAIVVSISASGVLADEVIVGAKGALYCKGEKAFAELTKRGAQPGGLGGGLPDGCGEITAGTKGESKIIERGKGFVLGVGRFPMVADGEEVWFVFDPAAPPPAPRPFAERTFKLVSPNDVRATPSKWQGRDIEFKGVNVYWVGDDDVRFITASRLTVFAADVKGEDIAWLRNNCETQKEALSSRCRVSIRFSYHRHDEDKPDGYSSRTVIGTQDILVIREAHGRRRK